MTVTAGSGAAIDVTQNTTGTNVSTEQFSNFPTQRTIQSLYTIAPTVTRSGLRDSSGRERDPSVVVRPVLRTTTFSTASALPTAFGGSGANLPFEFVQELEIKTGAYGADIGKATGGVFNVITKSGTNEFHGDAFAYFVAESFVREVKSSAIPVHGRSAKRLLRSGRRFRYRWSNRQRQTLVLWRVQSTVSQELLPDSDVPPGR